MLDLADLTSREIEIVIVIPNLDTLCSNSSVVPGFTLKFEIKNTQC